MVRRAAEYVTPATISGRMAEWLSCVRDAVAPRPLSLLRTPSRQKLAIHMAKWNREIVSTLKIAQPVDNADDAVRQPQR
jgi:hypothetical protein